VVLRNGDYKSSTDQGIQQVTIQPIEIEGEKLIIFLASSQDSGSTNMAQVAGFGLPKEGEVVVCKGMAYEWEVVEEIGEHFERWGWSLLCPACDLQRVFGVTSGHIVESLPVFD
jgi:hypothetical protein